MTFAGVLLTTVIKGTSGLLLFYLPASALASTLALRDAVRRRTASEASARSAEASDAADPVTTET